MIVETAMTILARDDFGVVIARAGLTRAELAKISGISTRTFDSLSRKEIYGRSGAVRESTAWKIAIGFAQLKNTTPEDAFNKLFVKEESQL